MSTLIGIIIIVITCLFALGVVRIAGNSIRNYDESEHESFLGK
ncbi:hypothetical protein N0M98_31410 [Paenibacillus doosanensis]|uniref:Uncharacterized protein n=1 Tax=Paenibacillus konkukensis TaxID=2020716 RepID=A0ABY4RKQ2_9BACL|nr:MULTISPECIES: hypothetical protein [Paenibacillus]MCS7464607.1 hypothetical protein [Paenibacillus doosanensis]UQZ82204.1 hypothetical protein SK3146_01361 [Paenibacillus konkukensis]